MPALYSTVQYLVLRQEVNGVMIADNEFRKSIYHHCDIVIVNGEDKVFKRNTNLFTTLEITCWKFRF